MSKQLSKSAIQFVLEQSQSYQKPAFILELVQNKKKFHLRLKGKNGEIAMHQECTSYQNARYLAARLLLRGQLNAKYKELLQK